MSRTRLSQFFSLLRSAFTQQAGRRYSSGHVRQSLMMIKQDHERSFYPCMTSLMKSSIASIEDLLTQRQGGVHVRFRVAVDDRTNYRRPDEPSRPAPHPCLTSTLSGLWEQGKHGNQSTDQSRLPNMALSTKIYRVDGGAGRRLLSIRSHEPL